MAQALETTSIVMSSHVIYRQINKDYAFWIEKRRFGQRQGGNVCGLLTHVQDDAIRANILFDCGLGTLQGLADLCDEVGEAAVWDHPLTVFITHGHIDHHAELMLLSEIYCQRRGGDYIHNIRPPLTVYCTVETQDHLYNTHRWGYTGGRTLTHCLLTPGQTIPVGPIAVHPVAVDHCPGAVIFAITLGAGGAHKVLIGWDLRSPPLDPVQLAQIRHPSLALIEGATWTPMATLTGHAGIQLLAESGFLDSLEIEFDPHNQRYGAYLVHYSGWEDPEGALSDGDMERRFHRTYPHLASVVRVAQRLQAWRFDF